MLSTWECTESSCAPVEGGSSLTLAPGDRLVFVGALRLRVLQGTIEAVGFLSGPSPRLLTLYSPPWDSALYIACVAGGEPAAGGDGGPPGACVVIVSPVEGGASSLDGFVDAEAGVEAAANARLAIPSARFLFASQLAVPLAPAVGKAVSRQALTIPGEWRSVVAEVTPTPAQAAAAPTSVFLCGAKGVGKSTLCRFTVNSWLGQEWCSKVAVLDCDLGQPELGPPGVVGLYVVDKPLLGPPHTHLQHAHTAFFCGATSPQADPELFARAVVAACDVYRAEVARDGNVPLVVNTNGWVRGLGLDLLARVLAHVCPAHVLQLQGSSYNRTFAITLPPKVWAPLGQLLPSVPALHTLTAWNDLPASAPSGAPTKNIMRSPTDLRALRIMCYFLTAERWKLDGAETRNATVGRLSVGYTLASLVPLSVPWDSIRWVVTPCEVPQSQVLRVLNASIVGLLAFEPDAEAGAGAGATVPPMMVVRQAPPPPMAPCLGLGIVRSIDPVAKVLHIVTPVPPERLAPVNMLALGASIDIPGIAMRVTGGLPEPYTTDDVVPLATIGGSVMKTRKVLKRKRFGGQQ